MHMQITEKERRMLKAIINSEFQDGQPPVGNYVWTFSVCEDHQDAGLLSSLQKKGLVSLDNNGPKRDWSVAITQAGFDAANEAS